MSCASYREEFVNGASMSRGAQPDNTSPSEHRAKEGDVGPTKATSPMRFRLDQNGEDGAPLPTPSRRKTYDNKYSKTTQESEYEEPLYRLQSSAKLVVLGFLRKDK